nr:MAG: Thioesterase domain-containing protein [Candidatus Kentron sp. DK]
MAGLLRAAGHQVGLLALADTAHPAWFRNVREAEEDQIITHLLAEAGAEDATADGSSPAEACDLHRFIRIYRANDRALRQYRPAPWEGEMLFLSAQKPVIAGAEPVHLAWQGLAGRLARHVVPGDHFTMHTDPNVALIARILKEYRLANNEKALHWTSR